MTKTAIAMLAAISLATVPGAALACDNHGPGEHASAMKRFNPFAAELAALSTSKRTVRSRDARLNPRLGAGLSAGGRTIFL